jgi:hypothetical protein
MYILLSLLHISTTQGDLQVTIFFQGIYRTAHNVTPTLSTPLFIHLVLYGVPSSSFCVAAALCTIGCTASWSCVFCVPCTSNQLLW